MRVAPAPVHSQVALTITHQGGQWLPSAWIVVHCCTALHCCTAAPLDPAALQWELLHCIDAPLGTITSSTGSIKHWRGAWAVLHYCTAPH